MASQEQIMGPAINGTPEEREARVKEVVEKGYLPEVAEATNPDMIVGEATGVLMTFEGQGTPEGDELILRAAGAALEAAKRARER